MAYASLLSLGETLEQILDADSEYLLVHQIDEQLVKSLHEKVGFFLALLDSISPRSSEKVADFEEMIRIEANGTENIIEFQIHRQQLPLKHQVSNQTVSKWLLGQKEDLDGISERLVKMKESNKIEILQLSNCLPAASPKSGFTNKSAIVGFDRESNEVKKLLFLRGLPTLEIISICGEGGLGKTTLARKIYNDARTVAHFDIRAWVTVSQEFREQQVLEDILNSIGDLSHESRQQSIDKLAEKLYKRLKHKRFLIVMDDVWSMIALKNIKSLFKRLLPEDNNGSRILLTTRSVMVATLANSHILPHMLEFLSHGECSDLLCHIVFRKKQCPPELEIFKEKIIKKCDGHPLATVLTGGLLYKAEKTRDYWAYVATNMHTRVEKSVLDILTFCYNQLPHHLRPCFLYMGVLPEDYAIRRSTLTKLWVASGFIKPHKLKSLEEVAEEYLQDLVDRCLIMVREWTHSGEIKTCYTHDLIRDFCLMKAKEAIGSKSEHLLEVHENLRHVSILTNKIPKLDAAFFRGSLLRSVTFFSRNTPSDINFITRFWFLRILDALTLSFDEFPLELVELVTLKYIALTLCLKKRIPTSIFKLCNLETLIINPGKLRSIFNVSFLPPEIWKMSRLRHLLLVRGFLPDPIEALNGETGALFNNLRTLTNILNFRWTKESLQMMPNLRKLVVSYEHDGRTEWSSYCFDNFVLLDQLEVLKCFFFGKSYMKYQEPLPMKFAFPRSLKRLTLSGCRISWKDMTIVGALPNLQVLKLRFHAFEGSVWEPNDGEFRQLKLLLIHMTDLEHWKANETHFPSLERLTLNYCYNLVEIPFGIGKIPTLQEINLCGCSASVVTSTKVIQEERNQLRNYGFRVMLKKDEDDTNTSS